MKIARKSSIKNDRDLERRLQREAAMLRRLQHPNIVVLYDVMETENSYYMVQELVEGTSLALYLRSKYVICPVSSQSSFIYVHLVLGVCRRLVAAGRE